MKKQQFNGFNEFLKKLNTRTSISNIRTLTTVIIFLIIVGIHYYVFIPVFNIYSPSTWSLIIFYLLLFVFLDIMINLRFKKINKYIFMLSVFIFILNIVLQVLSSEFLNARRYQEQITVHQESFSDSITSIPLQKIPIVDKASSKQLGDKQIGMVTALGSQYNVDNLYSLIIQNENLYRVTPLEYEDVFKWFQNRKNGIPAYIKINVNDPTDVKLVSLEKGIKYAPSAFLNENLFRHLRFNYPGLIFGNYSFELDDNDNPFWVFPILKPEIGFFGGRDSTGVVLVDPHTGETFKYDLEEIPDWVDNVYTADIVWNQIDNWGYYTNGFFNTLFSKKDMLQTTEGYNYVAIDNQLHMFSSLTSVGSDSSIVGFALINVRNKDTTFITVGGADEISAQNSAEGQVQHLGYSATDPILLNIGDLPTYFMGLKDYEGLVKMYSFVSVSDYSIVGIGNTVEESRIDYLNKINTNAGNSPELEVDLTTIEGEVATLNQAIIQGDTTYYFTLVGHDELYIASINLSSKLPLTKVGDRIKLEYFSLATKTINVVSFDNLDLDY